MTRNQDEITEADQQRWWDNLNHKYTKVFLFTESDTPVGYGLIKTEKGVDWISGGLYGEWRHMGGGRQIFEYLIDNCKNLIKLEVFSWNNKALRLYTSLGFKEIGRRDDNIIIIMELQEEEHIDRT